MFYNGENSDFVGFYQNSPVIMWVLKYNKKCTTVPLTKSYQLFTYNNIMLGSSEVEERVPTAGVFIFSRSDKHNDKTNSHLKNEKQLFALIKNFFQELFR